MDNEHERRLEALEARGLGDALTRSQIVIFAVTCLVLPAVLAVLGRGLL